MESGDFKHGFLKICEMCLCWYICVHVYLRGHLNVQCVESEQGLVAFSSLPLPAAVN